MRDQNTFMPFQKFQNWLECPILTLKFCIHYANLSILFNLNQFFYEHDSEQISPNEIFP